MIDSNSSPSHLNENEHSWHQQQEHEQENSFHSVVSNGEEEEIELEWEEWDGKSPYLHHCIAGSIAGVSEHTLLYPIDTVKTHMQAYCRQCPNRQSALLRKGGDAAASRYNIQSSQGMLATMRSLIRHGHANGGGTNISSSRMATTLSASPTAGTAIQTLPSAGASPLVLPGGFSRLWRGVRAVAVGCVPAHALYFSTYEASKSVLLDLDLDGRMQNQLQNQSQQQQSLNLGIIGGSIAGGVATVSHDIVMTPVDTIKQRMQLGHYRGFYDAAGTVVKLEGWAGLYRSFGVTLISNIPYGMIMVGTNEFLREQLSSSFYPNGRKEGGGDLLTTMLAGCGAGAVAAAFTVPLDRCKTRLQVQNLGNAPPASIECAGSASCKLNSATKYAGIGDAFRSVVREEGVAGLFRGAVPRIVTHTPAVAISWTVYEAAKGWLLGSAI